MRLYGLLGATRTCWKPIAALWKHWCSWGLLLSVGGSKLLETWAGCAAGDTGCSAQMLADMRLLVAGPVQTHGWSEELVREFKGGTRNFSRERKGNFDQNCGTGHA